MIAVIYSAPTNNNFYGATWAGPVVREIAEEIYANSPDWSAPITASGKLPEFKEYAAAKAGDGVDCVPDVTGMGLRDALVFLEKSGYEVTWEGHGAISSQVPEPGTVSEEKKVKLTLKEPERKKKDKDEQKSESAS